MTGEEFRSRFQVGERLTEPPVVTHRATSESGAFILVHYLLGSAEVSSASIKERVQGVDPSIRDRIREMHEVDGISVVVTDVLSDFSTFMDWIGKKPGEEEETSDGETRDPGVYTQLFRVSEMGLEAPPDQGTGLDDESPESAPQEAPPSEPLLPEQTVSEPVAANLLGKDPVVADPPVTDPVAADPEPKEDPGSYTMLFGKGIAPGAETPAAPPAAPKESPAPAAPTAPLHDPAKEEEKAPGSYTMLFGAGAPPQADTPPRPTPPAEPPGTDGDAGTFGSSPPPALPPTETRDVPEGASATGFLGQVEEESKGSEPPEPVFPRADPPMTHQPTTGGERPPTPGATQEPVVGPPPATEAKPGPTVPPIPPVKEKEPGKPGAYTQIFGAMGPGGVPGTPPPPAPPPSGTPHSSPSPPPPPFQQPQPPPPPPQESSSPGWQRWKDTPGASGRHIPSDDYLQHLSGTPQPGYGTPPPPPTPTAETGKAPVVSGPLFSGGGPANQGPGHYTMVREGLSTDPGLSPSSTPAAKKTPPPGLAPGPAPGAKGKSKLLPILGLVAVLLVIVAMVVVFALTG